MSKENTNFRLLGSPVNLSYRCKKKDDKKNIRNRPRSALLSCTITSDNQEKRRPFSADAKDRAPSTRNFLKAFSADLLQSYNNSPASVIVEAPTFDLLSRTNPIGDHAFNKDKDICSNASDYGSEDTFISLGTKIKAKAQLSPKPKITNPKNILKYRNLARKERKAMENSIAETGGRQAYSMEVKITERAQSPSRNKNVFNERSLSPPKTRSYESYFIPLESDRTEQENDLLGRVSFSPNTSNKQSDVEQAIDTYSRRLTLSKQQLSLVEEESTQDVESVPSHNLSSLSPEHSSEDNKNVKENINERNAYVVDEVTSHEFNNIKSSQNFTCEPRTYTSFYDDFHTGPYKNKLSSTVLLTDSSSKDSGYPDSGTNDDKSYRQNYSLPTTSLLKKSSSYDKIEDQPKSLDSCSTNSNDKGYHKISPQAKVNQWNEPLNHSRLLYKDFFLKKEGHLALPPQNSPNKNNTRNTTETTQKTEPQIKNNIESSEYPSYLVNSTTKAYTSKVIEDYKRELEVINSLHDLTIKDIKVDAISPTPLNIDKMFEEQSNEATDRRSSQGCSSDTIQNKNKNDLEMRREISKISTKELIQNYFKVKEGDFKEYLPKNLRKKTSNVRAKEENSVTHRQEWNNKSRTNTGKNSTPVSIKNQTQKNLLPLRDPLSAREDEMHNNKDIDSWMSLSAPSPIILEIDNIETNREGEETKKTNLSLDEDNVENAIKSPSPVISASAENDPIIAKELSSNSTVLDIYSMLKEIESFGDNPVTSVVKVEDTETKNEERSPTPKDNFMEIFEFLEKVEQSANDALSVVTNATPQTIPKLEALLKLPQTELSQRLVTASLQLEERSCCIALLQESLANHKQQMINKVGNLEKQSMRNIAKVKQECEETVKRHQTFIDQLINDKKTLNHRIEQLVDERRAAEERWARAARAHHERHQLELRNQHDKMAAAQQVARQRWVRQKAEKIKELTVKGLEGELREMAERQQKEISDLRMSHAEHAGRSQAKHAQELEELRRQLEEEKEVALVKERQLASSRLEKQILELEVRYQEQRTRLVADMRAENERVATELAGRERGQREEIEKWKLEQEQLLKQKRIQMEQEIVVEKEKIENEMKQKQVDLEKQFEQYKKEFEAEQQLLLKKKVAEIAAQHKLERDREIERAIENMETEAQAGRKELQDAMRRNKEQYEAELKEIAETEQATLRRYQDAQARVRQTEDRCAEFEVTITQLETRNRVLTEKNIQLECRAEEIRAKCEELWKNKVDVLTKEMDGAKKTHEEQMHQLYAKVKVAVARKDSAIQALTRETGKYQEKITILEQKLQQQRKDFLKQK